MRVQIAFSDSNDIGKLISMSQFASIPGAERTLRHCLYISQDSWTGFVDGNIACIWGVIPPTLMSNQAYLWLLTTELVREHQFLFVRHSQRVIEEMLRAYDVIVGDAIIGNDRGIRWLKWLGAEFGEPQGMKIPFRIRKK